jgi:hypothetical protein
MKTGYSEIKAYIMVQTDQMLIAQGKDPIYNVPIPVQGVPEPEKEKPKQSGGLFGGLV